MKELLEFEQWADKIIANEATQDRPLARSQDIQYQASREFPDRSPEQALQLYVSNKLADSERMDFEQNKLINAQKRENDKLRRSLTDLATELNDHERTAQDTEREVERLRDLSAKLKPAGEIQQQLAKASSDKVEGMMRELETLKNKPGVDDKRFKELSDQVKQISGKASDEEVNRVQKILDKMSQQQSVNDDMFNSAMNALQDTQDKLDSKELRFQSYIDKKRGEIEGMSKSNAQEIAKYAKMVDQYKEKIDNFDTELQNIDKTLQQRITTADELYTKAWSTASRVKKELETVQKTADQQDVTLNRILQLVGNLGADDQQQIKPVLDKLQYASGKAQSKVAAADDETQLAKANTPSLSGEELTGDDSDVATDIKPDDMKQAASALKQFRLKENVMNEEENPQQEKFDATQKAIDVVYPLYIRKYPGDAHAYPEDFLRKAMRDTIWTGLLIYIENDDFDEQYIFRYMENLQKKIHRLHPIGHQPELKGISPNAPKKKVSPNLSTKPRVVTPTQTIPGGANFPPGPGPGFFKESLVRQYEKALTKLTGGY